MSDLSTDAREAAAAATATADSTIRLPAAVPTRKLPGGHTVELDPNWSFKISGPLYPTPASFASFLLAKRDLEEKIELHAAAEIKTFSAIVLSDRGEPTTIRGINRRDGSLLGCPEGCRAFYPNVTWLRKTILKLREIDAVALKYERLLRPFQLDASPGHSSMSAETAQTRLARWKVSLAEKFDVAEAEDKLAALEAEAEAKNGV